MAIPLTRRGELYFSNASIGATEAMLSAWLKSRLGNLNATKRKGSNSTETESIQIDVVITTFLILNLWSDSAIPNSNRRSKKKLWGITYPIITNHDANKRRAKFLTLGSLQLLRNR